MSNRRYRTGYNAELRARHDLESQGYYVVRAAGSKGAVDLVGLRADGVLLVQVKSGLGRVKPTELDHLLRLSRALPPNASVEVWTQGGREGWKKERIGHESMEV